MVSKLMTGRGFNNREDLWDGLTAAFAQITTQQIGRFYDSMPRRLSALKVVRGCHMRY